MLLILLTLFVNTAGSVFIQYTWRVTQWDPPLVLAIAEATKFCISLAIAKHLHLPFKCKGCWKFGAPSLLYSLLNISVTYAYSMLPAHYIVTVANLKIVWAMCFTQRCLHRSFSKRQWLAAGVIMFGLIIISSKPVDGSSREIIAVILFGVFSSAVSSAAGTVCEYLYISDPDTSIHVQNVKMYAFGTMFNLIAFFIKGHWPEEWHWTTSIIVLYYALAGILISVVMKHLGNVARNLIGAVTMICVTVCSHYLLGNEISTQFIIGGCIVCGGTALYNFGKPVPNKQTIDDEETVELISQHEEEMSPV
ncbi:hypothetical protein N9A45_00315 [bacterium]|nr:hypothetical protein [bacterium]